MSATSVQWPSLFQRREVEWDAAWKITPGPASTALCPDYTGASEHPAARIQRPSLDCSALPGDFEVGVVFGPSGSGKTSILHELIVHYGLEAASQTYHFECDMALCSHPDYDGEAIDRLSCVGLNRIPSWLKPAGVLSDGERQRALCALSLKSGAVLDDFAVVVDDRNAKSMAASLVKFVRSRKLRKVLVATTKRSVLAYLSTDFVVFSESGVLQMNPWPQAERKPKVKISTDVETFVGGPVAKGGGWRGPVDDNDVVEEWRSKDLGAGSERRARKVESGSEEKMLSVSVKVDEACTKAADAFDYDFFGKTDQKIYELQPKVLSNALQDTTTAWTLGAIVGPSGSGKSTNVRKLSRSGCSNNPMMWDPCQCVVDQLNADENEALALATALAIPEPAKLRPFHVLSSGERALAQFARRLGEATKDEVVCLDEFTSCIDRTTAKKVCIGLSKYLRSTPRQLQVVVATVHEDILSWLLPDWVLESGSGQVTVFDGPTPTTSTLDKLLTNGLFQRSLSGISGLNAEEVRVLLKPPELHFTLSRLESCQKSREVYNSIFEEHHYLKGETPSGLKALLLRDSASRRVVAFHGIANQVGAGQTNMSMRESRLVVLPEYQGFGLGPRLSDFVGHLLVRSGAKFYSRTAHPRLGSYREGRSDLWAPTATNRKALKSTMGGSLLKKKRARNGKMKDDLGLNVFKEDVFLNVLMEDEIDAVVPARIEGSEETPCKVAKIHNTPLEETNLLGFTAMELEEMVERFRMGLPAMKDIFETPPKEDLPADPSVSLFSEAESGIMPPKPTRSEYMDRNELAAVSKDKFDSPLDETGEVDSGKVAGENCEACKRELKQAQEGAVFAGRPRKHTCGRDFNAVRFSKIEALRSKAVANPNCIACQRELAQAQGAKIPGRPRKHVCAPKVDFLSAFDLEDVSDAVSAAAVETESSVPVSPVNALHLLHENAKENPNCRACQSELKKMEGLTVKGRPCKHTCEKGAMLEAACEQSRNVDTAAEEQQEEEQEVPHRARVCFSHLFIGDGQIDFA